jgi:putative spermidine/putrescine transport system substrate-binding protein
MRARLGSFAFAALLALQKTGRVMAARMSRRRALALSAGALVGAPAFMRSARAQGRTVYVNSYGGVWESSWRKAFFEPFTAQTGIAIKTVPGVSFAKLKAQVQTRHFEWDVVNLGDVEYAQAVLEGLLEKVDKEAAKTDQLPPHMVREYGITSYSLGTNLVYRKDKFPNGGPQSWADFWDVKRFPGNRCFTTARSPALPLRCWPTACRPNSSIPWISIGPSAR